MLEGGRKGGLRAGVHGLLYTRWEPSPSGQWRMSLRFCSSRPLTLNQVHRLHSPPLAPLAWQLSGSLKAPGPSLAYVRRNASVA